MMDWTQSCTGRQARESLTEEATFNLRPKEETASVKHCEEKEPYVQAEGGCAACVARSKR